MTVLVLNKKYSPAELRGWLRGVPEDVVVACAPRVPAAPGPAVDGVRFESRADYADSAWLPARCRDLGATRIVAISESDVVRAAAVRELFGLPGQSLSSAVAYRDKYVMKSIARAAGVPTAPMALVRDPDEVRVFAGRYGYPVVVKPRDSGGSVGVFTVRGPDERFALDPRYAYVAESWIDDPLHHVDGLMHAGRVVHAGAFRYARPNLESARRALPCIGVLLDEALHPVAGRLRAQVEAVVGALPPAADPCAFHAEFFCAPDGEPVLCEIAARPSNTVIAQTLRRAYGYDLFASAVRGLAGGGLTEPDAAAPAGSYGWAYFPTREGTLVSYPEWAALPDVLDHTAAAPLGSRHRAPAGPLDHVATAVFAADRADPVGALRAVERWWEDGVVWSPAGR